MGPMTLPSIPLGLYLQSDSYAAYPPALPSALLLFYLYASRRLPATLRCSVVAVEKSDLDGVVFSRTRTLEMNSCRTDHRTNRARHGILNIVPTHWRREKTADEDR